MVGCRPDGLSSLRSIHRAGDRVGLILHLRDLRSIHRAGDRIGLILHFRDLRSVHRAGDFILLIRHIRNFRSVHRAGDSVLLILHFRDFRGIHCAGDRVLLIRHLRAGSTHRRFITLWQSRGLISFQEVHFRCGGAAFLHHSFQFTAVLRSIKRNFTNGRHNNLTFND